MCIRDRQTTTNNNQTIKQTNIQRNNTLTSKQTNKQRATNNTQQIPHSQLHTSNDKQRRTSADPCMHSAIDPIAFFQHYFSTQDLMLHHSFLVKLWMMAPHSHCPHVLWKHMGKNSIVEKEIAKSLNSRNHFQRVDCRFVYFDSYCSLINFS